MKCGDCKYYWKDKDSDIAVCRRYPPKLFYIGGDNSFFRSLFPDTYEDNLCGEFKSAYWNEDFD